MVLLIIDVQKKIVNAGLYRFDLFSANIKKLIEAARANNIEIIYARHDDGVYGELTKGSEGFEIYEEFAPADGERIFDKSVNSPFNNTGLLEYLNEKKIKTIIAAGLQTDFCVDAAVKCGFEHGFEMVVPRYANSTFDNRFMSAEKTYDYYNNFIWDKRYAKCISVEETLDLMRRY